MKKSELRELIREQVRSLIKEASVSQEAYTIHNITKCGQDAAQSFIDDNKLDGKKLAAYVRHHSNSKEKYDVRDIIAGTGVGANVSFKSRFLKQFQESVVTEGDMTNQYDGFIISSNYPKKDFKFRYIKGINNVKVENEAIAKLMKKFGEARPNFIVNGFVKKGQWDMDKAEIFKESVLKETFIGPFVFTASTPDKELIAMYHGALDGFSNYKTGMKFSKADYKLAYQTIEKILQKKGVAITEASITEAKEYSFTFDYNTDPDDIEYIENLLKKARVNAYAEQGTFDDEMVIKAGDAIELRKAKKAIEADGFQINEGILNAPGQKEWPLKFNINYDDLPANFDLRTASLNKLFQGIPYQHLAWPEISDDGALIFKTAQDLAKAKQILGLKESKIKEADDPEAGEAAPYGSGYAEVNEDAGMVVDVAMGVAVGLMGLWAMVQSAPLVGRVFGDAAEYLAAKSEKKAKMALKNQRKETIAPIIAKFKNDTRLADMYQALTPYSTAAKLGSSQAGLKAQQGRVNQLTKIGKYIKSKLTPEEMAYFRDISAMLRDGDIKESVVNEAIDIHNDESAMKALEDIAVNMTKWKGSEGAHYADLLEKVIDFLKYGNHRTS